VLARLVRLPRSALANLSKLELRLTGLVLDPSGCLPRDASPFAWRRAGGLNGGVLAAPLRRLLFDHEKALTTLGAGRRIKPCLNRICRPRHCAWSNVAQNIWNFSSCSLAARSCFAF